MGSEDAGCADPGGRFVVVDATGHTVRFAHLSGTCCGCQIRGRLWTLGTLLDLTQDDFRMTAWVSYSDCSVAREACSHQAFSAFAYLGWAAVRGIPKYQVVAVVCALSCGYSDAS